MIVEMNFLEDEELYYYYLNWRAGQENMIHKGGCGFCTYSSGTRRENITRGENGVWIGPFSSIGLCEHFVTQQLNRPMPSTHTCINRNV